ncbi:MAG: DUF3520 domain-containing protein, partial [Planctomycetes bacterium]|nr:DUF3520 domain-containing protein [Planctomycetota bacterium]
MGAPSENGDWLGADSERPDAAPLRSVSEGPSDHEQGEPCLSPLSPPLSPGPHAIAENDALPNIAGDEMVDPLKYQTPGNLAAAALGISDGEVATVKLRYKHPDGDTSQLLEVPVIDDGATLSETSEDFRFAASVASFGMLLRDSPYKAGWTYDAVLE